MPLSLIDQKHVDDFFAAIKPIEAGYTNPGFSYLAVRHNNKFVILQARLALNTAASTIPFTHFRSKNICSGHYSLKELELTPRKFIQQLLTGKIETPKGPLLFPPKQGTPNHSAYFQPFHPEGLSQNNRLNLLGITGETPWTFLQQPQIDWELKGGKIPYDSLAELAAEYRCGIPRNDAIQVEIIGFNIVAVDLSLSVSGTNAKIGAILAASANPNKVKLGYKIFSKSQVIQRKSINGSQLKWQVKDKYLYGEKEITVPNAAVIQCIASYNGIAQHQGWISDPKNVQNARRSVYQAFDDDLETLNAILFANGRAKGRDFESGVSCLLAMAGFSTTHLGKQLITDAPDIIVSTPSGHIALVECTTGLPNSNNKLSKLYDRAVTVRRALTASNNQHLNVLPVVITNKTTEEIKADIESAERLGICILSKENLESLLSRTLMFPQADQLYSEAKKAVEEGLLRQQRIAS
jgi:hypothetical protein